MISYISKTNFSNGKGMRDYFVSFFLFILLVIPTTSFASTTSGTVSATERYAWSENMGWIDFGTTLGAVTVTDSALSGYAFGENIGWISLNCSNTGSCGDNPYKIANNSEGTLSGYAWSENAGWINFAPTLGGVTVSTSGVFSGYAYGENIGWINFTVDHPVTTDWRPASTRVVASTVTTLSLGGSSGRVARVVNPNVPVAPTSTLPQVVTSLAVTPVIVVPQIIKPFIGIRIVTRIDGVALSSSNNGSCSTDLVAPMGNSTGSCVRSVREVEVTRSECENMYAPDPDVAAVILAIPIPSQPIIPKKSVCGIITYKTPLERGNYSLIWKGGYPSGADTSQSPKITGEQRFSANGQVTFYIDFEGDSSLPKDVEDEDKQNDEENSNLFNLFEKGMESITSTFVSISDFLVAGIGVIGEKVELVSDSITDSVVASTVKVSGAVIPVVTLAAGSLSYKLKVPTLLFDLLLEMRRVWGFLLLFFGIKKKRTSWGTVFDSVTKQPLDPALVTARDVSGRIVGESITDLDGRYGFLLPRGEYVLKAEKTHCTFPSENMKGKRFDEVYSDLYFGEVIRVDEGQVIEKNIPMDPTGFDWNEFTKHKNDAMYFHSKNERVFSIIRQALFDVGLLLTVLSIAFNFSILNIFLTSAYVALCVAYIFGFGRRAHGTITESKTGAPASFSVLSIYTKDKSTLIRKVVADKYGRYYCLVPPGDFYIEIEMKNNDEGYTAAWGTTMSTNNKGIIRDDFRV